MIVNNVDSRQVALKCCGGGGGGGGGGGSNSILCIVCCVLVTGLHKGFSNGMGSLSNVIDFTPCVCVLCVCVCAMCVCVCGRWSDGSCLCSAATMTSKWKNSLVHYSLL